LSRKAAWAMLLHQLLLVLPLLPLLLWLALLL
jgi:hypothetical protein